MKTYTIFGLTLVTGDKDGKVEKLAAGTHFLTAYGNKRGGKRKVKGSASEIGLIGTKAEQIVMDDPTEDWQNQRNPVLEGVPERCEHGKGLTDYCLPCGRIHGQEGRGHEGGSHVSD